MITAQTPEIRHADYSDCVRNFREYAVLLDQLANSESFDTAELNEIAAYLQQTAQCIERRDHDVAASRAG